MDSITCWFSAVILLYCLISWSVFYKMTYFGNQEDKKVLISNWELINCMQLAMNSSMIDYFIFDTDFQVAIGDN